MSHGRIAKKKKKDLWENKLEMDIENTVTEWAYWTEKKNCSIFNVQFSEIVAKFSFYKDKMNILKNCKKFKNSSFSIF